MEKSETSPHSREAERIVLGLMLSENYAFKTGASSLDASDFYFQEHVLIFKALQDLCCLGKSCEIYLAAEQLKNNGYLESIGGVIYLIDLAQFAGTSSCIHEYIDILRSKSLRRRACVLLDEGKRALLSESGNLSYLIERQSAEFYRLGKHCASSDTTMIGDVLSGLKSRVDPIPLIKRIEGRKQYYKQYKRPFMTGMPTGFSELDRVATILEEMNLVVIAARPAMGKTAFAINIANHVCIEQKKPVAIFSLEMGADQIAERCLSLRSGIAGEKIKRGDLTEENMASLKTEEEILRNSKLFIIDRECSSISQVISKSRRLKEDKEVSLFIIDYLQLMNSGEGAENRQCEIAEISRKIKSLTMELKTPFICISQLSRKVEERKGHRPIMSDLRDSGQIEQDSDVVLFIQRSEYYNPGDEPGRAELIIAKNRNGGATSSIPLHFDGECGKFSSIMEKPLIQSRIRRKGPLNGLMQASLHPLLR